MLGFKSNSACGVFTFARFPCTVIRSSADVRCYAASLFQPRLSPPASICLARPPLNLRLWASSGKQRIRKYNWINLLPPLGSPVWWWTGALHVLLFWNKETFKGAFWGSLMYKRTTSVIFVYLSAKAKRFIWQSKTLLMLAPVACGQRTDIALLHFTASRVWVPAGGPFPIASLSLSHFASCLHNVLS